MARTKEMAVISAAPDQLAEIESLVKAGKFRTLSEFVRLAIDEKIERMRRDRVAQQLEAYCEAGHAGEDVDLSSAQAFPHRKPRAKR